KQYLHLPPAISTLAYIIPLVVIDWSLRRDERNLRVFNNKTLRYLVYIIMIIMCYLYIGKTDSTFIYFQF
ncbi:MAG: hypothetical protein KDC07_00475, partial [Chitinophagaceae bacterium]|nr:hypothetical protein [Chitinophagaceae bacterium]